MSTRKFLLTGLLASALSSPLLADQLTVDVTGIEKLGGYMMVAVYNDASAWKASEGAVAQQRDSVTGPRVRVIFADLSAGPYAVMLYHDENGNGELDANMLGIPSESYGFSNNGGRIGRPSFDEARFEIAGDTAIEITLR